MSATGPVFAGGPLVVPGAQLLLGDEQEQAERRADLLNPEAVRARAFSRTAYANLDMGQVGQLLRGAFPEVIDQPADGAPELPPGARILDYSSANAAQIALPGKQRGIVESLQPIAHPIGHGRFAALDLELRKAGNGYSAATSDIAVQIPKQLSAGVETPGNGVSLTPVDSQGRPLGGSQGAPDGSSIVYANTQLATDTLVKPTATGFQIDAVLRGVESPQQLYFRVAMPTGAKLVQNPHSGVVSVVLYGHTLAMILPPGAQDTEGTSVPVSMRASGDVIALSVDHRSGSYQYPIDVDPSIIDNQLATTSGGKRSNWEFGVAPTGAKFADKMVYEGGGKEYLETYATGEYKATEVATWIYQTRGNSKIYEFKGETEAKNKGSKIESFVELQDGGTTEEKMLLSTEVGKTEEYARKALPEPLCPKGKETCVSSSGGEKNAVHFQQSATASGNKFSDFLYGGEVSISEPEEHATTGYNRSSPEIEGEVLNAEGKKEKIKRHNVLDGGGWLSKYQGALEFTSEDKGIGVSSTKLEYEYAPGKWEQLAEHNYLEKENLCKGVQCEATQKEFWVVEPKLPNGEDKIRYRAKDAMAGTESTESEGVETVKVDTAKPHGIYINGLPYGNELSEKEYNLTVEATDGEGSTVASSGIKGLELGSKGEVLSRGIALFIDGHEVTEVGKQSGCYVPHGECTATAQWTLKGSELGAGKHEIEVVVFDNAGNEQRHYEPVSIRHSTPVVLGPGSVDLESGDFTLGDNDVSLGSGLTVSRNYSSRAVTGTEGPLGPQWNLNVGTSESLTELIDHSMLLTDANGAQTIFAKTETNTYESPIGDSNLTLTVEENAKSEKLAYYLKDAATGSSTKFTLPSESKSWMPARQEGTVASDTVIYTYRTVEVEGKKITEPTEELGPVPAKVECSPTLHAGCRVLKFAYATSTTATGENRGEWGKYNGRLEKISYDGYNPATKAMVETAVAQYEYDKQGRLRAEWDPRISPALKTTYGYDAEGHVTALTPPGQESWVFTYGTIAGDAGTGRLLKATQATATSGLWGGELPKNTEAPKVTGTPVVGVPGMSASAGAWTTGSNAPVAYAYQWKRCNSSGLECESIVGATNSTYTPVPQDSKHTLVAQVSAMNGGGSTVAVSAASAEVKLIDEERPLTKYSTPYKLAVGSDGNIWYTDHTDSKVMKFTAAGIPTEYQLPAKSEPSGIVAGPDKNLWFTESGTKKIGKITTAGVITEYSVAVGTPNGITAGPDGNLWFTCDGTSRVDKITTSGTITEYEAPAASEPAGITAGPDGNLWFTQTKASKVGKITTSGTITSYGVGREPDEIVAGPDGALWFTDNGVLDKIGKITTSGTVKQYEVPNEGTPVGITVGADKNLWYTVDTKTNMYKEIEGQNKIGKITTAGVIKEYALGAEKAPNGIVSGPEEKLWFAELGNIGKATTAGVITEQSTGETSPDGITTGSDGNLWFTNSARSRIAKMALAGGVTEYALPAGSSPTAITAGPDGNLWFTEGGTSKIGKITTSGAGTEYALAAGAVPSAITVGSDGNLWFTEGGTSKIGKITTSGTITEYSLPEKSGPDAIASGPDGDLWFTENASNKIGKITTSGTVTEYSLPAESSPNSIVAGPEGNLWFTESGYWGGGNKGIGKITTSGTVTEYPAGSIYATPKDIVLGPEHNLWFEARGFAEITTSGTLTEYVGSENSTMMTVGPDGNLWFTYSFNKQIGKLILTPAAGERPAQPGWTMEYKVPLEGAGAPAQMGVNSETHKPEPEKWGQTDDPVEATAIFPSDSPQGWPASSYTRASTYYLDEQGRTVNFESPSTGTYGSVSTTEYNEENDITRSLSAINRATALEAGGSSVEVAKSLATYNTYRAECSKESENNHERESREFGTRLCETEGPQHEVKYMVGKEQKEALARDHTKYFYDENVPTEEPFAKETFNLVTETVNLAELENGSHEEVESRITTTSYSGQKNLGWKLRAPTSVTTDPNGLKITHTTIYNEATAQVTEVRGPKGTSGESAHDMKTIYYTSEENKEGISEENKAGYPGCGNHPEWSGLVCVTSPAKQPATTTKLPVTETTYNMWNEPETITEKFGTTTTRTKKNTYDSGGRLASSETTATGSTDASLPKVTYAYESSQGVIEKQSTTVAEKTQTISSVYNTLGQLASYTDADGNVTKYKYGGPEKDYQVEEVSDSSNESKSKQTYTYNATTRQLEKLVDSAAETFTASYDMEGRIKSEVYPNGMCANYTYNSVGQATHLEYIKTTNCAESKPTVWFSETQTPSVHGETMSRASTLAGETYAYDSLGRLTEVQETPAGEGCKVRAYAYDEESNRESLTTRVPGSKGECAKEGGTVEKHTYDEANRLTDTGIEYESLGNVTKLPAADAEKHELTSAFYVDGAVASQSQNGVTNEYKLDPSGRVRNTISGGKEVINHYDGAGETVSWTCELVAGKCEASSKTTRNIPGIDGGLAAVQTNGGTPVLQLQDLDGNVVATASLSPAATELLSKYNSTEFGVPNAEKAPPMFAWLGANDVAKSLSSGVITYGATSYVPQTDRPLQSLQVESPGYPVAVGGGTPATFVAEAWNMQGAAREGAEAPGLEAARARAAAEAALRAALAAAGEGVDPTYYYTWQQAENIGRKLEALDSLGEYVDFVTSVPDGIIKMIEGEIVEHFDGVEKAFDWFKDAGEDLVKCGKSALVCQFSFKDFGIKFSYPALDFEEFPPKWETQEVNLEFVNVLSPSVVDWCLGTVQKPGGCFKSKNF